RLPRPSSLPAAPPPSPRCAPYRGPPALPLPLRGFLSNGPVGSTVHPIGRSSTIECGRIPLWHWVFFAPASQIISGLLHPRPRVGLSGSTAPATVLARRC